MISQKEEWARSLVHAALSESINTKQALRDQCGDVIVTIAQSCAKALADGHKILLCGNGGSAADAQHLAAEFLIRLTALSDRQPLPAMALATDVSTMTACGNDYGFDRLYERMVDAFANSGDVLIGITTSGNSENILRALKRAREKQVTTIGFLGGNGGLAREFCDVALQVPSQNTSRVQESHIAAGHIVVELVEQELRSLNLLRLQD